MNKLEQAIQYAGYIVDNDYHGYSQQRRGERDRDCSKLTLDALKAAGIDTGSATYTGNALKPLLAAGFKDVTAQVNRVTGRGLKAGDVLLRPKTKTRNGHMSIMLTDTILAQAQQDYDGVPGDSSGRELRRQAYYNSPFTYVLRYQEAPEPVAEDNPYARPTKIHKSGRPIFGNDAKWIIWNLERLGYTNLLKGVPVVGPNSWKAIWDVQTRALNRTGDAGPLTYAALEK